MPTPQKYAISFRPNDDPEEPERVIYWIRYSTSGMDAALAHAEVAMLTDYPKATGLCVTNMTQSD